MLTFRYERLAITDKAPSKTSKVMLRVLFVAISVLLITANVTGATLRYLLVADTLIFAMVEGTFIMLVEFSIGLFYAITGFRLLRYLKSVKYREQYGGIIRVRNRISHLMCEMTKCIVVTSFALLEIVFSTFLLSFLSENGEAIEWGIIVGLIAFGFNLASTAQILTFEPPVKMNSPESAEVVEGSLLSDTELSSL